MFLVVDKRKFKDDTNVDTDENDYEWFMPQRSKHVPISGPVLQEYVRCVAEQPGSSTAFQANKGCLNLFRSRYSIQFRTISGEVRSVVINPVADWITRFHLIIEQCDSENILKVDETGLFFKLLVD